MASDPQPDPLPPHLPGGAESTFQLVERVRGGDQAALEALFARYLVPLRRWAAGRLPQWARDSTDTQDLVQETLLQTFKRIDAFEPRREGALQAYLRQALMNRIRDELRRVERRGTPAALDSQILADTPSPLEEAIGRETVDRYERALERLSAEDREAIIGRLEMGCTYAELAVALGKSTAEAARMTTRRALARLAALMNDGR